jgi:hypothetical protein
MPGVASRFQFQKSTTRISRIFTDAIRAPKNAGQKMDGKIKSQFE